VTKLWSETLGHFACYIHGQGSLRPSEQFPMTIFQKLLRLLTPADQTRKEAKSERAERTEKAIERYDAMLNASVKERRGRPHSLGR
jgi:hypothetical protein